MMTCSESDTNQVRLRVQGDFGVDIASQSHPKNRACTAAQCTVLLTRAIRLPKISSTEIFQKVQPFEKLYLHCT